MECIYIAKMIQGPYNVKFILINTSLVTEHEDVTGYMRFSLEVLVRNLGVIGHLKTQAPMGT